VKKCEKEKNLTLFQKFQRGLPKSAFFKNRTILHPPPKVPEKC
jgi:hypothetical protein